MMLNVSLFRTIGGRLLVGMIVPLIVAGCATAGGNEESRTRLPERVVGRLWQWEAWVSPVEKFDVPGPERYTFELMPDGKVRVRFDCNRGGGTYQIADGRLTFGPLVSTRMGCPPGSLGDRFGRELGRVTTFFLEQGKLYLELPVDSGTMRFRVVDEPAS